MARRTRDDWTEREQHIRPRMEELGLGVGDVADACGVARQTVHAWFTNGEVPSPQALRLAAVLQLDDAGRDALFAMLTRTYGAPVPEPSKGEAAPDPTPAAA